MLLNAVLHVDNESNLLFSSNLSSMLFTFLFASL